MVLQQLILPFDLSLLVRDSLRSFNKLKCSIDDIGADIRPFYEKNLKIDKSNSLEQLHSSVLKYHIPDSINTCYGTSHDPNLRQLASCKNQNERYLDELIDHLMKNKDNRVSAKQSEPYFTIADKELYDLSSLIESLVESSIVPYCTNIKKIEIPYFAAAGDRSNFKTNYPTTTTNKKDINWERFKSNFVVMNSEYYFPQINAITSVSPDSSLINNISSGIRLRKIDNFNSKLFSDEAVNKCSSSSGSSTMPTVQRTKIDIVVTDPHNILFKNENQIYSNVSLNISMLDFLYLEQVILFNNLKKSNRSNLLVVDLHRNTVIPQLSWLSNKLPTDTFGESLTVSVVPYATFVSTQFRGYFDNDSILIENWMLLGSQLALMKVLAKGNAVVFRQTHQFMDIIIETSWNHLCLKEKRRLMKSIKKKYPTENTVDIIYCYYCNKDRFYPSDCPLIKESTLWKCIFCSLRCGDIRAAAIFAEGLHLENVVFSQYIRALADSDLDNLKELREALLELYTFEDDSKLTVKRLVISLLLNFDDIDPSVYFQNFDDLLWFKFSKAYFFKQIPLSSIRADINDLLAYSMNNNDALKIDPLVVSQALIYCGDYVSCINYLCDFAALSPHMINLAIAMYMEGVISVHDHCTYDILNASNRTDKKSISINLRDIFLGYIKKLSDTNVDLAVEYVYIIKDINSDLVVYFMTQISLNISNISRLFGNILPDGSHTDCLLNWFEKDSKQIFYHVARIFEKSNDLYHAIRIYDISCNYKKVVKLINKMLCETICLSSTDRKRKKIFETSNFILNRMVEQNWNIDNSQRSLFEFLHDYLWLENLMSTNDLISTLQVAEDCRFIPTNSDSFYDFQRLIKNLPPIAFRFFGNFIQLVASLFYRQHVATIDPLGEFCFNNQDSSFIKTKMKCLVKMVTQMCTESIIPSDAMQAVLLIDNKIDV